MEQSQSKIKRKPKKFFPLTVEELRQLAETDSGIVLRTNCRCCLKLNYTALPVNSDHFKNAVSEELNRRILKYNHELNDMVLKYVNIKVLTPIEANRCRKLRVACLCDVFVFKPRCDSILTAVVNKKSKNHIGCLIYNVFNVSIIRPPDLLFHQWPGRHIEINDNISFKVIKVDVTEAIPYIIGELDPNQFYEGANNETDGDSVISTDHNSLVTSDEQHSDLDDVMETVVEDTPKSRKRKISSNLSLKKLKKPKMK